MLGPATHQPLLAEGLRRVKTRAGKHGDEEQKGDGEMTLQRHKSDQRPSTTVAELQTMSELIQRYPAEAQLIMSALEDGLTLGPMQAMEAE